MKLVCATHEHHKVVSTWESDKSTLHGQKWEFNDSEQVLMIQNNLKASAQCACKNNKAVHTWKKLQVETVRAKVRNLVILSKSEASVCHTWTSQAGQHVRKWQVETVRAKVKFNDSEQVLMIQNKF